MNFKNLAFCGASLLASTLLFSCAQENEPVNIPTFNGGEYVATIQIPDGIRTRAAAQGSVGNDGLYTFSRTIDKLWYAIYQDGKYLYDSETEAAPQPVYNSDGKFTLTFNFDKANDPSKTYIFFWAGSSSDNVTTDDVTTVTDGINLNFKKRCVSVDPKYMNGDNERLEEFDSFSGYVQLSESSSVTNNSLYVTLQRPFAQIHILSDEFTVPGVSSAFPNGVTVVPGYGSAAASTANYAQNLLSPTTWFFDDEIDGNYKKNEYKYDQTTYNFTNELSGSATERVTFKNRKMDYLGCYYVFAPVVKADMKAAATDGGATYGKLNIALYSKGSNLANAEFATVSLPEGGIKANNKYVIYNKPIDGSGNQGGGGDEPGEGDDEVNKGFLSTSFLWDVIIDDAWGDDEVFCACTGRQDFSGVAWGVNLKEESDSNWGVIGNTGMWQAYKAKIGRYLMTNDGKAVKLDAEDSSKYAEGGDIDESKGQVVVIAPNLYYYVQTGSCDMGCECDKCQVDYPILWMSEQPFAGSDSKKIGGDSEYLVIGAYLGTMEGSTLVSHSGAKPQGSKTITDFWNAAQENGSNWGLTNWDHARFMMMLGMSEYGTPNMQESDLGRGLCGSNGTWSTTSSWQTGGTKEMGDKVGKLDAPTAGANASWVNLFGVENPYGHYYQMLQGIYFGNSNNAEQDGTEVFIYEGNRLPSESELQTHPEGNYRQITRPTSGGYVSKMYLGDYFDLIGKEFGANSDGTSHWGDYFYSNSTGQLCLWGGGADSYTYAGLGCVHSDYAFSHSSADYGARLAYYGPVQIVTASEIE